MGISGGNVICVTGIPNEHPEFPGKGIGALQVGIVYAHLDLNVVWLVHRECPEIQENPD